MDENNVGKKPIRITENTNYTENKSKTSGFSKPSKYSKILLLIFLIGIIIISIFIKINIPIDIEQIKDSVVMIEVYDEDKELMSTGSGFCVFDSNCIITNFHVIEGAYSITIITDDNIKKVVENVDIINKTYDMAILKGDFNLKPLEIGSTDNLKAGMEVTAIGSPEGEKNTVSTGIISNADNSYEIRITAPISPGSSGGVLLNKNNKVIGVTFATYDSIEAQNLNYAISIDYFKKMYNEIDNGNNYLLTKEIDTDNNYRPINMSGFYRWTNKKQIFYHDRLEIFSEWQDIFDSFSKEKQKEIIELYTLVENYKSNYTNIKEWKEIDYIINLTSITTAEYLIILEDLTQNTDNIFEKVNSYNLSVYDKACILLVIGGYEPSDLSNADANIVCDTINDKNLSIEEKTIILENLGYTIKNERIYW